MCAFVLARNHGSLVTIGQHSVGWNEFWMLWRNDKILMQVTTTLAQICTYWNCPFLVIFVLCRKSWNSVVVILLQQHSNCLSHHVFKVNATANWVWMDYISISHTSCLRGADFVVCCWGFTTTFRSWSRSFRALTRGRAAAHPLHLPEPQNLLESGETSSGWPSLFFTCLALDYVLQFSAWTDLGMW